MLWVVIFDRLTAYHLLLNFRTEIMSHVLLLVAEYSSLISLLLLQWPADFRRDPEAVSNCLYVVE